MGAGANSSRNKALNEQKERAASRQEDRGPAQEAILDAGGVEPGKGKGQAGGAHGQGGQANLHSGNTLGEGGGGGGGEGGGGDDSPDSDLIDMNGNTEPAKQKS